MNDIDDSFDDDIEEANERQARRRGSTGNYRRPQRDRELDQRGAQRRTPILPDKSCCSVKLDIIEQALLPAKRSKKEIAALSKQASGSSYSVKCSFNYSRLRDSLIDCHVWDQFGSSSVHHVCLAKHIGVTHNFLTSLRGFVIDTMRTPIKELSKREVLTRGIEDDVIIPVEFQHLSVAQYLQGLDGAAKVQVPARKVSHHGLSGKPSNHSKFKERRLFEVFVKINRSPTGRTRDASGRVHGAE